MSNDVCPNCGRGESTASVWHDFYDFASGTDPNYVVCSACDEMLSQ